MRLTSITRLAITSAAAALAAAVAMPAAADTSFGVRTGVYTEAEAGFVGAEVLTSLAPSWYFDPNLEYAFAGDRNVLAVSGDFHYDFVHDRPYWVWAGAGPAVLRRDTGFGDRETDLGLNLLGGMAWKKSQVQPYVQGKVTLADTNEAVLAVGVRF
jgi:hypothetical protein